MKNLLVNPGQRLKIETLYSKIMESSIDETKKKAKSILYHANKKSKKLNMGGGPSLRGEIEGVSCKNSGDYIKAAKKDLNKENINTIIKKENRKLVKLFDKKCNDIITKVIEKDLYYEIYSLKSFCLKIDKKYGIIPRVEDKISFYGLSYNVRGIDINGEEVFYVTKTERKRQVKKEVIKIIKKINRQSKKDKRIGI